MSSPTNPGSPASSLADALSFSILSSICGGSSDNSSGTGVHFSDLGSTSPRSQALSDDEDFVLIPTGSNALSPTTPRTAPTGDTSFSLTRDSSSDEDASEDEGHGGSSDDTPSSESDEEDIVFRGAMAALGISSSPSAPAATPTPPQPAPVLRTPTQKKKAQRKRAKARKDAQRTASESSSDESTSSATSAEDAYFSSQVYEDAVAHVSTYLNAPPSNPSSADRLHFLQSLVIELGLLAKGGNELPTSVKSAKRLLQEQVHINVKQYLAWRSRRVAAYDALPSPPQGRKKKAKQAAEVAAKRQAEVRVGLADLQKVMYPSKSALRKSLKGTGSSVQGANGRMPLDVIKKAGLNIFLVNVFR